MWELFPVFPVTFELDAIKKTILAPRSKLCMLSTDQDGQFDPTMSEEETRGFDVRVASLY